jgi:hypothetical protein
MGLLRKYRRLENILPDDFDSRYSLIGGELPLIFFGNKSQYLARSQTYFVKKMRIIAMRKFVNNPIYLPLTSNA